MQSILWAATGTGFTFLMTTLGAAMVFLFRKQLNASIQRIFCLLYTSDAADEL